MRVAHLAAVAVWAVSSLSLAQQMRLWRCGNSYTNSAAVAEAQHCTPMEMKPQAAEETSNMKYIGESPDGNTVFSYRTDRVRKEQFGGYVSAWLYGDNKKPAPLTKGGKHWQPYMRSVENLVFSCTTASYYTDSSTYYDGNGGVLVSVRRSNVMERAIPDTVADIMMRAVCLQVGTPVE